MRSIKIFIFSIIFIVSCKSVSSDVNVIKGSRVDEKDYPTAIKVLDSYKRILCSGMIVSENVVLTAAHCVMDMIKDEKAEKTQSLIGGERWVRVNGSYIKSVAVVFPVEYMQFFLKNEFVIRKVKENEEAYIKGKKTRSQYESTLKGLKNIDSWLSADLGAIIFDNNWGGWGNPPFKSIIEKAKKDGKFFSLSKNSFEDGTVLGNDKKSVFFLGYGSSNLNSYYDVRGKFDINDPALGKLQIGYNSITYFKKDNYWMTPRPERGSAVSLDLLKLTNTYWGDSGSPLIYKDQIVGVVSAGEDFDCEGNGGMEPMSDRFLGIDSSTGKRMTQAEIDKDSCARKYSYSSSIFTSITLGSDSKIAEAFIEEVNKKLSAFDLLKNGANSIFSELLENNSKE